MDLIETIFSRGIATIIMLPLFIIILIFYNKVFWFVGGLFKIKDPFWRIRVGGGIILIIYTIILIKSGLV